MKHITLGQTSEKVIKIISIYTISFRVVINEFDGHLAIKNNKSFCFEKNVGL